MPSRFDAVFSDVVMPGIGGVELARRLRVSHPDLPVILTTGYSDVLARDDAHGFELVSKPYSAEQVARALREAELDRELFRREHFEMTNALRVKEGQKPFTPAEWEHFVQAEIAARTSEILHFAELAASYPQRRRDAIEQARQEGDSKPQGRPTRHGRKMR
jgi:CheY-like chemotaxis protein